MGPVHRQRGGGAKLGGGGRGGVEALPSAALSGRWGGGGAVSGWAKEEVHVFSLLIDGCTTQIITAFPVPVPCRCHAQLHPLCRPAV